MNYLIDLSIRHPALAGAITINGAITVADALAAPQPDPQPAPAPEPLPPALIDPSRYGKLTLPVDSDGNGSADEIPAAQLPLAGGYQSDYFRMVGGAAVFTAPVDGGGTTSNAKYVRSELREQTVLGSDRDNWPLTGTHIQRGRVRVDQLPARIGTAVVKTVIAQIHGVESAPPIKVQVAQSADGQTTVYGIFNVDPLASGTTNSVRVPIAVGEAFDYEILVQRGVLTLAINGDVVGGIDMNAAWQADRFYFKAGNYVQNTPSNATGRAVVTHIALSVEHRP